ncbi:glycine oxidase ThiO [Ramlibacter rhizophilus]|uniref:Glycine oxidase ThiO n=1 Tax=Ramlibacter rhizophilus TaxID=1781167 RepID=A0A4Z0BJQ5_9BURK|nr:glycine oxidase ThiO [Ramlibacter rhizophilus]TFY98659.1 glycine oxidase ThiO [Ramlibacter rhizophilus]
MSLRIAIAGAGLLGRLFALHLARAGHAVRVFDPAPDAQARGAAGWTAAGMLSPVAELECADEQVFALGLRSLALWPALVASLPSPVDLRFAGSLLLAHRGDEGAARRVIDLLAAKAPAGRAPQPVTGEQLRELEPDVQRMAHAWLLPGEGQIDTVQAMAALAEAAAAAGARFHWSRPVESLGAGWVQAAGERTEADWVIDVRGTGARPEQPVRGVRGEIIHLHAPGLHLNRPLRLLHPRHRVYIVPRTGDRIVVGASEIESEDRSPISVRSIVELLTAAHSVLPALAEARLLHTDTNLRPALPDNLPELRCAPGMLEVNGLFRHGWLIAPALVEEGLARLGVAGATDGNPP